MSWDFDSPIDLILNYNADIKKNVEIDLVDLV